MPLPQPVWVVYVCICVCVCVFVQLEVFSCHFNVLYLLEEMMIGPLFSALSLVDDRIKQS